MRMTAKAGGRSSIYSTQYEIGLYLILQNSSNKMIRPGKRRTNVLLDLRAFVKHGDRNGKIS